MFHHVIKTDLIFLFWFKLFRQVFWQNDLTKNSINIYAAFLRLTYGRYGMYNILGYAEPQT